MFQPYALFLGLRYSRTRRSSRFVSFILAGREISPMLKKSNSFGVGLLVIES